MEKRAFLAQEIKAVNDGKQLVSGYAATYGSTATLPGFRERIANRSFDKIMRSNPDVCCLVNHDPNMLLGRTSSGTLRLAADDKGLRFECDLPQTSYGRDTYALVKRQDLAGMSFAFTLQKGDDEWSEEDGTPLRMLRNFSGLHDVAICTFPAYSQTSVDARQLELVGAELRSRAAAFKPLIQTPEQLEAVRERYYAAREEESKLQTRRRRDLLEQV